MNNEIINKRKFEISQEIRYLEKERDRSLKWFFINFFIAFVLIAVTLLSLWYIPELVGWVARKMHKLPATGLLKKADISWVNQIRLDYIKWISFFLLVANLTVWLFWAVFRFRKWSKYQRRIEVLEQELKELEKSEKK